MTALILDVDDTLVDTARTGWRKCWQTARDLGLAAPSWNDFVSVYGSRAFAECVRFWHPGVDIVAYQTHYDALADQYPPIPLCDLGLLLDRAREQAMKVGVLTNGSREKTARKLAALGATEADFDYVSSADDRPLDKSHPGTFGQVRAILGQEAADTWMVSDLPQDWRVARRARLRTIGVHAITWRGSRSAGVDVLLPQLGDLCGLLAYLCEDARRADPSRLPVSALSFDVGGTLLEEIETPEQVLRTVIEPPEQGVPPLRPDIWSVPANVWSAQEEVERALIGMYQVALKNWGVEDDGSLAEAAMHRHTHPDNWRTSNVAGEWLLKQGAHARLGVVSNWSPNLATALERHGFGGRFEEIVCSTVVGTAKPSPKAFGLLADGLNLKASEIAHLGDDHENDVAAAHRAGMCAVLVGSHNPPGYLDDVMSVLP